MTIRHECADCGVNTKEIREYYMLTHPVWKAATQSRPAYMLCIGCVEVRLGRRLTPQDFLKVPVNLLPTKEQPNRGGRKSDRLRSRIEGTSA